MEQPYSHEHAHREETIGRANDKLTVLLVAQIEEAQTKIDDGGIAEDEVTDLLRLIRRRRQRLAQIDRTDN